MTSLSHKENSSLMDCGLLRRTPLPPSSVAGNGIDPIKLTPGLLIYFWNELLTDWQWWKYSKNGWFSYYNPSEQEVNQLHQEMSYFKDYAAPYLTTTEQVTMSGLASSLTTDISIIYNMKVVYGFKNIPQRFIQKLVLPGPPPLTPKMIYLQNLKLTSLEWMVVKLELELARLSFLGSSTHFINSSIDVEDNVLPVQQEEGYELVKNILENPLKKEQRFTLAKLQWKLMLINLNRITALPNLP